MLTPFPSLKLLTWIGVFFGSISILAVVACGVWPRHYINFNESWKITEGMSLQEVEEITGCPPGNYSTVSERELISGNRRKELELFRRLSVESGRGRLVEWVGNDGIAVAFLVDDKVHIVQRFH